jgi:acetyl esterase/lipase
MAGMTDSTAELPPHLRPFVLAHEPLEPVRSGCREAGREVDVIDVAAARHAFETVDDTDAARDAIRASIAWWANALR